MSYNNPFPRFSGFGFSPAIAYEEGVTRRDPSPVIKVDDLYHVWYSRNTKAAHGFTATIWHAISQNGTDWREVNEAVGRGASGAFDACGVFTPTVLVAGTRYYLYYTAMPHEWHANPEKTRGAIGMAIADSPDGPWKKRGSPILTASDDPEDFDSLRVDDTCIVAMRNKYWMYYKGRQWDRSYRTTKMGLAVADSPLGPWQKHESNPVLNSGHEVCVWPHADGVGCLVSNTGPQANTLQYSLDGLHFQRIADTVPPKAPGPYREDNFVDGCGPGITWGLCMADHPEWPYLLRFDCDLTK
jgi:predicted GH43/DUF377 family glycosyl hydrolase